MALAATAIYKWAWGLSEFLVIVSANDSGTYGAGGYTLTPGFFTLNTFASTSDSQLQAPPTFSPVFVWANGQLADYAVINSSTGKLQYGVASTGAELTGSAAGVTTVLACYGH
jgi:hypothetical protein